MSEPPSFRSSLLAVLLGDLVLVGVIQALLPKNRGPLTALTVVGAISIPFVVMIAVRPVLRRLAWRELKSQGRSSVAYLLTAVLGTAAIVSAFSIQNALAAADRRPLVTQLGPLDEIVDISSSADRGEALRRISDTRAAPIDGVLALDAQAAVVALVGSNRTSRAQVLAADLTAASSFGGEPTATGLTGPLPTTPAEVAISADLADRLDARAGDQLRLDPSGSNVSVTVLRVLPRLGLAGLQLDRAGGGGANVFVGGGVLPGLSGAAHVRNLVFVSNAGGARNSAKTSASVTSALENALAPTVSSTDGATTSFSSTDASVITVKADAIAAAESASNRYRAALSGTTLASILVGTLLLIATALSIADQRRQERGVLRAMGLRRAGLLGVASIEGWIFAITSAMLGAGVGAGVARVVVTLARRVFGRGESTPELSGTLGTAGLGTGLAVGFIAALAATIGAALWESRRDALAAARGIPAGPPRSKRVLPAVALLAIVSAVALAAIASRRNSPTALLVGLPVGAAGLALAAYRPARWRLPVTVISIATAGAAFASSRLLPKAFERADSPTYVLMGIVIISATVAIMFAHLTTVTRAIERVGLLLPGRGGAGPRSLAASIGAADARTRPGRTGVVMTTFAFTAFTAMLLSMLSQVIDRQTTQRTSLVSGGFAVQAEVVGPVAGLPAWTAAPGVAHLGDHPIDIARQNRPGFRPALLTQFDDAYAQSPAVVDASLAGIRTNRDAFAEVLRDPGMAIVAVPDGEQGRRSAFHPGDLLPVRDPASGRSVNLTIVGVTTSWGTTPTVWTSAATATNLVGALETDRLLLTAGDAGRIVQRPGTSPARTAGTVATAAAIAPDFGPGIGSVRTIAQVIAGEQQQGHALLRLLQAHLAVGFLTALAGLASVLTRAVQERRRSFGVLRSIGAPRSALRRALLLESVSVSFIGAGIGTAAALLCVWRLLSNGSFGRAAQVPVAAKTVLVILFVAMVAAAVAALLPARRATASSPAAALR